MLQNETVTYQFNRVEADKDVNSQSQYTVVLPEGVTWMEIMRHFAAFLDQCGYVGVSQHVDYMFDLRRQADRDDKRQKDLIDSLNNWEPDDTNCQGAW